MHMKVCITMVDGTPYVYQKVVSFEYTPAGVWLYYDKGEQIILLSAISKIHVQRG